MANKYMIGGFCALILVGVFLTFALGSEGYFSGLKDNSQGVDYSADVCIYKNGELVECNHNTLYNEGKNLIRNLIGAANGGAALNITLCNASTQGGGNTCGDPVAAQTEDFNATVDCGLLSTAGTFAAGATDGNWSVSNQFTASCDDVLTNVTRLGNNTDDFFLAGNSFSLVTLQTSDTLTVNWTLSVN